MVTAGIWLRVSTDEQSEDNQLPDCEAFIREHGYTTGPVFRVHGRSAWKPGRLDKDKAAVLEAFRTGLIDVLVVWSVDRWSRAGIGDTVNGLRLVKDAGGRCEFVKDAILNVPGDVQELLLALLAWVANFESNRRSDRVKNGFERVQAEGGFGGGDVAFGYHLVNNRKVRDEDELKIVREIHERSERGESSRTIEEWLARIGYPMHRKTVAAIIRNDEYVADEVVTAALAKSARDALDGRRTGPTRRTNAPDYSAMVHCPCGKVMHRKPTGRDTRYYCCTDHERVTLPDGKLSPRPMVRADEADELIDARMSGDQSPWMIPHRVGGDTREADIAKTWVAIERATKRRDMAEVMRLQAELPVIEAREAEPERVEWLPSGKTRGQRWDELSIPERRAWLESEDTEIVLWPARNNAAVCSAWNVTGDAVPGALTLGKVWMVVDQMDYRDEDEAAA